MRELLSISFDVISHIIRSVKYADTYALIITPTTYLYHAHAYVVTSLD